MSYGSGRPASIASRPAYSDHNVLVSPTIANVPSKRIVLDAGASQAVASVRIVIDPIGKADALNVLKNVLGECIILGRNEYIARSAPFSISHVYGVAIGTAVNGYVVSPGATEAQFLAAMFRLDFASVQNVRRVNLKAVDVYVSAGTLNSRYLDLITEGVSYGQ